MKEKIIISIIGGVAIAVAAIPVYNSYMMPATRHTELIDKFNEKLEK